ncbi:MAG: hypothetical protein ACSLEY_04205 [Candidatus Saccharimonadales bacterium]
MEPKSPESSADQLPTPIEFTPISPEVGQAQYESTPERPTRSPEQGQELHNATTVAAPIQTAQIAAPIVSATQAVARITAVDDNPSAAADEDLIEKEWVDKAKQIISTTKQDPYRQEREVGRLQADYLKKRYGKELGSSS